MASSTAAKGSLCTTCEKNTGTFICGGCARAFCTKHANEHRQLLGKEMDEIVLEYDQLRQTINEKLDDIDQYSTLQEIEQWEQQSIHKIKRAADIARENLKQYLTERTQYIQTTVQELTENLNKARIEDDFVETDLKLWSDEINELMITMSASIPIFFKNIKDDDLILLAPHCRLRVIELPKTAERLGISIHHGREDNSPIYISDITPNGVAWQHGGLKKGDQLLFVNGVSVENDYEKAVDLIKQAQGSVKLTVRYFTKRLNQVMNDYKK